MERAYKALWVKHDTHRKAKQLAAQRGLNLVDFMEEIIREVEQQ